MRIKELKLHNFRGIKDLDLIFDTQQNVIVLVGVNGVGKSSILDCINALVRYHKAVFRNESIENGYPHSLYSVYPYGDELVFRDGVLISESDVNIDGDCTINQIKMEFNNGSVEWKIAIFKGYASGRQDCVETWKDIHKESKRNIANKSEDRLFDSYCYFLSNRRAISLVDENINSQKIEPENIITFERFREWFKELEGIEQEQRLLDNLEYRHPVLTAVRNAIQSFLGENYGNLTFRRAVRKMTIEKSGKEISLELLSDGEKNLLAMVGHLSRKLAEDAKNLDNLLHKPALVLIDEIELHLHPEWQRMIIPSLTKVFPNCQFIVTTHSPQVLSHVDPECIYILDYDEGNVVVKRPESSYGLDSNRILEDILGVSKRPQEIQECILELFKAINNNDLENAKKIVRELGDRIGTNEPELLKAQATIKRREIIGR